MSNDPAMNNSGYDRVPLDYYPTPEWITKLIVQYLHKHFPHIENVLEPAAGEGHMSNVLERHYTVSSYDLVNRGNPAIFAPVNFLTNDWSRESFDAIITNPPYGDDAKKFIRHGISLIKNTNRVMVMVLRNEFDCQKGMMDCFQDCPEFYGKMVLTKRPLWVEPKEGEKSGSPRHNYSIFVWSGMLIHKMPVIQYAHPAQGYVV